MREILDMLRGERRARLFFIALAQSSLGTGAAYVALLLLAYERLPSPLAISVVLLANLIPSMLLGPLFGALADRLPRRTCVVAADLLRAGAFMGLALVESFEATVAFAVAVGVGTALFVPASLAALGDLVPERRLASATSLYGALDDLGYTAGPVIAALLLIAGGAEGIMVVNGVTFAISAVLLLGVPLGRPAAEPADPRSTSLVREAVDGVRATSGMPGIRVVLAVSSAALFFGGAFNVAELLFATEELGAASTGFAVLVATYGLGFIAGSVSAAGGGAAPVLKRRYLRGLLLMALGFLGSGFAPGFGVALATFALAGFGNGLMLVYERLLTQLSVPERLLGRVFGVKDALTAWAFGLAFLSAGGVLALVGPRALIVLAGAGAVAAWAIAAVALRDKWTVGPDRAPLGLRDAAEPRLQLAAGEDRPHGAAGHRRRLALLDDLDEAGDDRGIELRAGVRG